MTVINPHLRNFSHLLRNKNHLFFFKLTHALI